ncbi:class C sortase [Blautia liquoris]|uniref:Class C sortase n=1 Tax=Blautia liquoris TaxID=2779518 RepID=A0A7M2RGI0_9FIRM|nr:class C sortase [Blautia liquoris]QOV18647.1 class C sortase [Blautia liquoris]
MKKKRQRMIGWSLLILGIGMFCYPQIAKYLSAQNDSILVSSYRESVTTMPEDEKKEAIRDIQKIEKEFEENTKKDFQQDLQWDKSNDIFAVLELPSLKMELPIYLGATEENLGRGIAVIQGTSLPMGGIGTHCVLAGHSGFANHEWFSKISHLDFGDVFYIHNLEGTLSYKVNKKEVIDETDTGKLQIQEDKDLVTLLTCTYLVSGEKKRLIVTGERV